MSTETTPQASAQDDKKTLKVTERAVGGPMPGRPGGGMVGQKAHDFKPSARRVIGLMRPERGLAMLVVLLAAGAATLNALGPKILGRATDLIFEGVVGRTLPVLFEKPGRHPGQAVGRSPYLQGVHADGAEHLIGRIVPVRIEAAGRNSLTGALAKEAA